MITNFFRTTKSALPGFRTRPSILLHNGADMQMQYLVDEVKQDADDEEYELNTSPSLENEHPGGESTDDSTVAVFCGSPIEVAASSQSA